MRTPNDTTWHVQINVCRHTQEWTTAYELCRDVVYDCAQLLTWEPVTSYALEGALRAHGQLQKEKGEEWMDLALAYMRVCTMDKDTIVAKELSEVLSSLDACEVAQSGKH